MKKHLVEISALIILSGIITGIYITAFTSFFHPFLLFLLFFSFVFLLGVWVYTFKQSVSKECAILSTLLIALLLYAPFKNCIHLNMVISTEQEGEISLYYAQSDQNFNEGNCIKYNIKSDKNQEVAFSIPVDTRISTRIDLDNITDAKIHSLVLKMFNSPLFVYQTEHVTALNNIDIHYENGDMYIHASGDDPHFVLPSFLLLPYLIIFVVMACCILLPLSSLACVLINKLKPKYYSSFVFLLIFLIAFTIVFMPLLQNMKISPSNLLYQIHPWSNSGIRTQGPILSDPIDVLLPKLYNFKSLGFSYWTNSNVFGLFTDPFVYIFNYANWFKLLFSEYGVTIITVLKHMIAFAGMYLLLQNFKLNKSVAFVGAITFTFSSVMVMWGQWDHTTIVALMPWLFYFIDKFIQTLRYRYVYFAGFILCFMHAANMTAYVAYAVYLLGAYVLFNLCKIKSKENRKVIFISFSTLIILSTMISAVFFGDIFEGFIKTNYIGQRMNNLSSMTLDLDILKLFLSPYSYGGSLHINEAEVFTGLFSVIAFFSPAFIKINFKENKEFYFWWFFSVCLLFLIFTHLLDIPFNIMPILNSSRKYRVIVLLNFTLSIVAAYSFSYIQSFSIREHSKSIFSLINGLLIVLYVYFVGLTTESERMYFIFLLILLSLTFMTLYFKDKQGHMLQERLSFIMVLCISINMALFAKEYIPYLESSVPIIPDRDQSEITQYLIKHSDENSRFASLNTWNFPGDVNVFYGLKSIRGHETVVTDEKVHRYLMKLDNDSYVTETFTNLSDNANENLLLYSSVKLIAREPFERTRPIFSEINEAVYEKTIDVKTGYYNSLLLKMSGCIGVKFELIEDGLPVAEKEITKEDCVLDNYVYIEFDRPIRLNSLGKSEVKLSNISRGLMVEENDDFVQMFNGKLKIMSDGVIEECDANNRILVTRNIKEFDDQDEILSYMSKAYEKNTAFIQSESIEALENIELFDPMSENEIITNIIDSGDHISFDLYLEKPAYVIVSDMYDDGWKAYMNGEEIDIIRTNFLFKGLYIDQTGPIHIEMRYHSSLMDLLISVSLIGIGILSTITIYFIKRCKRLERINENRSHLL